MSNTAIIKNVNLSELVLYTDEHTPIGIAPRFKSTITIQSLNEHWDYFSTVFRVCHIQRGAAPIFTISKLKFSDNNPKTPVTVSLTFPPITEDDSPVICEIELPLPILQIMIATSRYDETFGINVHVPAQPSTQQISKENLPLFVVAMPEPETMERHRIETDLLQRTSFEYAGNENDRTRWEESQKKELRNIQGKALNTIRTLSKGDYIFGWEHALELTQDTKSDNQELISTLRKAYIQSTPAPKKQRTNPIFQPVSILEERISNPFSDPPPQIREMTNWLNKYHPDIVATATSPEFSAKVIGDRTPDPQLTFNETEFMSIVLTLAARQAQYSQTKTEQGVTIFPTPMLFTIGALSDPDDTFSWEIYELRHNLINYDTAAWEEFLTPPGLTEEDQEYLVSPYSIVMIKVITDYLIYLGWDEYILTQAVTDKAVATKHAQTLISLLTSTIKTATSQPSLTIQPEEIVEILSEIYDKDMIMALPYLVPIVLDAISIASNTELVDENGILDIDNYMQSAHQSVYQPHEHNMNSDANLKAFFAEEIMWNLANQMERTLE